ncbi:hypothetical protein [Streptomyces sp. CB01881]|uniref:hypothetical protein n=1 Tax=Streptomyces sp. CB01881 TaxID=2078691 RepID=UPI000CDC40DB|nr:hypothetical protein [Streptomyces sp. CB01881]AUY50882.1 hypothetical protein C2142_20225 [Streptomyces sp. CB01881]TYC74264.1 hypothetical protein EH183_20205 [Streptomyces sp. CB01881]
MTIDPVLIKSSFAAVEPHGPATTGYFHQHPFEHDPGVRDLLAEHLDEQQDRLRAALGAPVTPWRAPTRRSASCATSAPGTPGTGR